MTVDYISSIKKLFDDAKSESIEAVNLQLNKFREVNQMGKFTQIIFNKLKKKKTFFKIIQ